MNRDVYSAQVRGYSRIDQTQDWMRQLIHAGKLPCQQSASRTRCYFYMINSAATYSKMPSEPIILMHVYLDTNQIEGNPINRKLTRSIDSFLENKNLQLTFFLPETVYDEHQRHLLDEFRDAYKRYECAVKDLNLLASPTLLTKEDLSENEIIKKWESIVKEYFHIAKIPVEKINWRELVHRAVFTELPFEDMKGNRDKGFKDAVIAETIANTYQKEVETVVISGDKKLIEYIKSKNLENISFYTSLEAFTTDLNLRLKHFDPERIRKIRNEARQIFGIPGDNQSLFESIVKPELFQRYPSLLVNPESLINLFTIQESFLNVTPSDIDFSQPFNVEISEPALIGITKEGIYNWSSKIKFIKILLPQTPIIGKYWVSNFHYIVEFEVFWVSQVRDDGEVISPQIQQVQEPKAQFQYDYS